MCLNRSPLSIRGAGIRPSWQERGLFDLDQTGVRGNIPPSAPRAKRIYIPMTLSDFPWI